jgi:arylsulfatase A-like enzyme
MARHLCVPTIFLAIAVCYGGAAAAEPNILLIISDDQGVDSSAQYALGIDLPVTPILDGLADSGLVFDNVWATPTCATTRASILTGKHGFRTDFNQTPGVLRAEHTTIQQFLATHANAYASGVFGKWHVGGRDENHPATVGVDYFAGSIGNPGDYFDWDLTINGVTAPTFGYHTTVVTDLAIEWIEEQSGRERNAGRGWYQSSYAGLRGECYPVRRT